MKYPSLIFKKILKQPWLYSSVYQGYVILNKKEIKSQNEKLSSTRKSQGHFNLYKFSKYTRNFI